MWHSDKKVVGDPCFSRSRGYEKKENLLHSWGFSLLCKFNAMPANVLETHKKLFISVSIQAFLCFFCAMQLHSLLQAARPPAQLLIAWNHQPHEQTLPPRHNPSRSTGVKLNLWSDRKGRKPTSLFSAFTREWRLSTSLHRPTSWQAEVKSDRPLEFY